MANPLQTLGVLNRLKSGLIIPAFPQLNVTASFLAEEGISLRLNGAVTTRIQAMTGTVPSPEPFVPVMVTINLLKSQTLSSQYKAQMEDNALIGNVTVRADTRTLSPYNLSNCSIDEVGELSFNGKTVGYAVTIGGNWIVNNSLWN